MEFDLDGSRVFAATGGRPFAPPGGARRPNKKPGAEDAAGSLNVGASAPEKSIVFLHGAGMDHTVWSFQARHFAHRGLAVLAPDFPGHGRSAGDPLSAIAAMADWTIRALDALGLANAIFAGHSMGARVALEVAARLGGRARGLALVGVAERMAVHPELRRAAEAGEDRAVDMILKWSFDDRGAPGGVMPLGMRSHDAAPGLWLKSHTRKLLERALKSALGTDLAACDEEQGAAEAAARVTCPAVVIWGADDRMTPGASARKLAERIAGAVTVAIPRCGHMSMIEEPAAVTAAIAGIA